MPDYEARINTKFGELVVHFNDKNELDARLQDINTMNQVIETKTAEFAILKEGTIAGLEGICTILPSGLPHIITYPEQDSDKIRLALYASARPLTPEEITSVTGVYNPTSFRVFDEEVIKSGGKFILNGKGRTVVSTKLLPLVRRKLESPAPTQ